MRMKNNDILTVLLGSYSSSDSGASPKTKDETFWSDMNKTYE